jgi:hypothetical protein
MAVIENINNAKVCLIASKVLTKQLSPNRLFLEYLQLHDGNRSVAESAMCVKIKK